MTKTKKLTFSAVACAISLALLFIATLIKTGTLAIQYIVGLTLMLTVSTCGIYYGAIAYVATTALCFILLPDKSVGAAYLLFFGAIPIIKFFTEKFGRKLEWVVKILLFNLLICGMYFAFKAAMLTALPTVYLWIGAFLTAIGYDILLSYGFSFAQRYFRKTP